jgi:putative N6-adenine-specific DNA methylase
VSPVDRSHFECFATSQPGLERLVEEEVRALGGSAPIRVGTAGHGGVSLEADPTGVALLNRELRIASQLLVRLGSFRARTFAELERKSSNLEWARFLPAAADGTGPPVHFEVTSRKSRLYHTGAIEERLRRVVGVPPATDGDEDDGRDPGRDPGAIPPPRFVVRILRDEVTISADSSGTPLHRRGYRLAVARAPLRETIAAALVRASGWQTHLPLVDPFCGSGTIPIEAAMVAAGIPPGAARRFAFEGWPGWGDAANRVPNGRAEPRISSPGGHLPSPGGPLTIAGSDRDDGAVEAARGNAERAGVDSLVSFRRATVSDFALPGEAGHLVTNPPWGERVGRADSLRSLYQRLGDRLRSEWPGARLTLLVPDRRLAAATGIPCEPLFRTGHGGITVEAMHGRVPG